MEGKKKRVNKKKGDELTGPWRVQSNEIKFIFSVNQYSFRWDKRVEKISFRKFFFLVKQTGHGKCYKQCLLHKEKKLKNQTCNCLFEMKVSLAISFPSHLKYFTLHPNSFLLSSSVFMLRCWQKHSNKFLAIFVLQLWSIWNLFSVFFFSTTSFRSQMLGITLLLFTHILFLMKFMKVLIIGCNSNLTHFLIIFVGYCWMEKRRTSFLNDFQL